MHLTTRFFESTKRSSFSSGYSSKVALIRSMNSVILKLRSFGRRESSDRKNPRSHRFVHGHCATCQTNSITGPPPRGLSAFRFGGK